jgi:prepilin-type N-terminal cleavage/methylation domain-containing protein
MMDCNRDKRGFTLVEMMVTIGIMAILLGISISTWNRYTMNTNLKTAARMVASDFFAAKQRAVQEATGYQITFNVGTNSYQMTETATGDVIQNRNISECGRGIILTEATFSGNPTINFYARGTAQAGRVSLTNGINSTGTITVNVTGRTFVQFNLQ